MDNVADALVAAGKKENADFMKDGSLDDQIKKCMVDVIKSGIPTLTRKRGFFDLLGCDFMVTSDNELILLEINSNPALSLGKTCQAYCCVGTDHLLIVNV